MQSKPTHDQHSPADSMPSTKLLAASLLAISAPALAANVVDDSHCGCFVTDGNYPTYYKQHGFWDFRFLSNKARVPPVIKDVNGNLNADFTSDYFNWDSEFAQFWGPQHWSNEEPGFPMVNSYNNLYIEKNADGNSDTHMTMRSSRLPKFQTAAEFESMKMVDHASLRMYAKTAGSSGVCTSIFTYRGAEHLKDVQEADIEMLSRESSQFIHYTNQPSYLEDGSTVDGASENVTLPNSMRWTDWTTHRLDWTPGRTTYLANGVQTHTQTFQAPRDPSTILLNTWSDGGEWTGTMPQGGEAYQRVQWIEMLYNVVPKCNKVCSIDKSPVRGKAVLL